MLHQVMRSVASATLHLCQSAPVTSPLRLDLHFPNGHLTCKWRLCADSTGATLAPHPLVPVPESSSATANPALLPSAENAAVTTGSAQAAEVSMPAVHGRDTANTVAAPVAQDLDGLDGNVAAILSQLRSQGDQAVAAIGRPPLQPERQQQRLMALDDMLFRIKRCFRVSHRLAARGRALAADASGHCTFVGSVPAAQSTFRSAHPCRWSRRRAALPKHGWQQSSLSTPHCRRASLQRPQPMPARL